VKLDEEKKASHVIGWTLAKMRFTPASVTVSFAPNHYQQTMPPTYKQETRMFIQLIKIKAVRHLKNLEIDLGEHKQHLILTGKNGRGKTTLLNALAAYLDRVEKGDSLRKAQVERVSAIANIS
jgi:ABC-type molybdenum transport system ATPase subunit/photorepair protein PhrA